MLPPNAPGVLVAIASLRAGATPTHPSIGRSPSSRPPISLLSRRAMFFALSRSQFARGACRSVRPRIEAGVTAYGASAPPEYAVARLMSILVKVTAIMSPGSAPSIKNGPVCGFGPCVTGLPFQSVPPASTVFVITRSPGLMRSAGGWANENVL